MVLKFYFKEIKYRSVFLLISFCFSFLTTYFYKSNLIFVLLKLGLSLDFNFFYLIFTDILEMFNAFLKVSFFINKNCCLIIFFYQIISFLSLGLNKKEFFYVKKFFLNLFIIFLINFTVFNPFLFKVFWLVFFNFNKELSLYIYFEPRVDEYITFYIEICNMSLHILFIIILINLFIKSMLKNVKKKMFYIIFLLISTIFSSSDFYSQLIIFLVFIVYFEIFIFLLCFKSIKINLEAS